MSNIAILIGNSTYESLPDIPCCANDLVAIRELLEATGKYGAITVIEDKSADKSRSTIRAAISNTLAHNEVFFYFTGHGFSQGDEFFFCTCDFQSKRPNETGLSQDDLHILLRQANAKLIVKVIDACSSGTSLIKRDSALIRYDKSAFKHIIQISSCLDSQSSLTGNPLSPFTETFRLCTLRKSTGAIYYTDIINSLKDEFIDNDEQTPHFVSQGTGREKFTDDARTLDKLRKRLETECRAHLTSDQQNIQSTSTIPSLQVLLQDAQNNIATSEVVESFVGNFFSDLVNRITQLELSNYFDVDIEEYPDYQEQSAAGYIIRVLSREHRTDEFVTAKISKEKKRSAFGRYTAAAILGMFGSDDEYREVYDLWVNVKMEKAQICVTFVPKYSALRKMVLAVSCAPSLEKCYIFEVCSAHRLKDFGEFHEEGKQIVKRWYKVSWNANTNEIVESICSRLGEEIERHLETTRERLAN